MHGAGGRRSIWNGLAIGRCRSGATAAEFALVMPLMTAMLFGIVEFGTIFFSYSAMQLQASRAARAVAVNTTADGAAASAARAQLPGWMRSTATISITQTAPGDPNTNLIRVRVASPSNQATPIPILSAMVPWQLNADVTIKQELPYVD